MAHVSIARVSTLGRLALILLLGAVIPAPTVAGPPQPCNDAAIVWESIPKDTVMRPGEVFVKTWEVKNTGSCTWGEKYSLVREEGLALGGPEWQALPATVWSGWSTDVSIRFTAPWTPGIYASKWHLVDEFGWQFGPDLLVEIAVPNAAGGTELPDTLTYLVGGGGGASCKMAPPRVARPTMTPLIQGNRKVKVCAYGLPANSLVTAHLLQPNGGGYSSPYYVGDPIKVVDGRGEFWITVFELDLLWPDNAPNGYWRFSLYADRVHLEDKFFIQSNPPGASELRILPPSTVRVFDSVGGFLGMPTFSLAPGEVVRFVGYGYAPYSEVALGIYRSVSSASVRVDQLTGRADANGSFQAAYRIPAAFSPGSYWVVAWPPEDAKSPARPEELGRPGTMQFFIRATADSPLLYLSTPADPKGGEVTIWAGNLGRASTRGGTITVSSPDVTDMKIVEADVPIKDATSCDASYPVARMLGPGTRCTRGLRYNTNCRSTVLFDYPTAEAWYKPWSAGAWHELTVAFAPREGMRQVRLYVRAAAFAGTSGCRMETAPADGETKTADQQGFPARLIVVPVP